MAFYYSSTQNLVKQFDPSVHARWVANGNPKALEWKLISDPPSYATGYNGTAWETASLADVKARKIMQINGEAGMRIEAKWPLWAQNNVALGIYGPVEAEACKAWIAAVITASNIASDAVDVATTIAQVDAVTVSWPV